MTVSVPMAGTAPGLGILGSCPAHLPYKGFGASAAASALSVQLWVPHHFLSNPKWFALEGTLKPIWDTLHRPGCSTLALNISMDVFTSRKAGLFFAGLSGLQGVGAGRELWMLRFHHPKN